MKRAIFAAAGVTAAFGMVLAGADPGQTQTKTTATNAPGWVTSTLKTYDPTEWKYWGGDAGQTRYVPIDQINASNVSRLKIAWRWSADTSGGNANANFKATPLLDDGVLYTPWLNHGMAAIDAGTGKTIWTFEPQPVELGGRGASLAPRSLAYWTDGRDKRLFHNSLDGRLICVDAKTGKACGNFGENGWINLRKGIIDGTPITDVGSVSPSIVVGDVVIVQMIPGGSRNKESAPGNFRGFDVKTGALKWTFNVIPRPGEFGNETWENESWKFNGNTGSWTMMSADPQLGYVYLATDTPSNDFSGVDRPGNNLFAESIVCLDAKTGKRVWHFQTVHHGVWDYDNPAAPILHDLVIDGKRIKAVTQLTKQGFLFVFDRVTGKPVWPIEERAVPQQGAVPGEKLSKTQPFPTRPAPITKQGYNEDWLIDFTPELRAEAVEIMKGYTKGPIYTPVTEFTPTNRGTLVNPGFGGGANWNGAAFDPSTGVMYIPIRTRWSSVGVAKGNPANTNYAYTQANNHTVQGPKGLPIMKPPYSEFVAVDMNRGVELWRTPIGGAPDSVRNNPALKGLNLDFDKMGQFDIRPGPLLIKDLIFMGESGTISASRGSEMLKAYDKRTGRIVWQMPLPTLSTGAPMTYMHNGRQYIVIAVSAPGKPSEFVALTLDGVSENGPPPAGGVQVAVAPVSTAAAALAITASPEELALGKSAYDRACAACHSGDGSGGVGPDIRRRSDFANIVRVTAQGQGEMPAMANSLTPAEIDAIGKHVVKIFNPAPGAGRGGRGGGGPPAGGRGGDD